MLLVLQSSPVRPAPIPQRLKSPLPRLNLPGPFCSHRGSGFFGVFMLIISSQIDLNGERWFFPYK
ncbi:hypothetical protein NL533_29730, partial [Klebsiella pneumoniae]|nr:hypothetical protein [Klebsiella pneumoniae]